MIQQVSEEFKAQMCLTTSSSREGKEGGVITSSLLHSNTPAGCWRFQPWSGAIFVSLFAVLISSDGNSSVLQGVCRQL